MGHRRRKILSIRFFQQSDLLSLRFEFRLRRRHRHIGQSHHAAALGRHRIQRAIHEHRDTFPQGFIQQGAAVVRTRILDQRCAGLVHIHRALQDREMVSGRSDVLCRRLRGFNHARHGRGAGLIRRGRGRIGRNAIPAQPARFNLPFAILECQLQPRIKFIAQRGQLPLLTGAEPGRVGQEILRVVEQTDIQRRQSQAIQRQRQLIRQELRMDAMPDVVAVLHHVRIGLA